MQEVRYTWNDKWMVTDLYPKDKWINLVYNIFYILALELPKGYHDIWVGIKKWNSKSENSCIIGTIPI